MAMLLCGCSRYQLASAPTNSETQAAASASGSPETATPTLSPTAIAESQTLALMVAFTFPVDDLSATQARALMDGSVRRWSEIGGPDLPVRRIAWQEGALVALGKLPRDSPASGSGGWQALEATVAAQPGTVALLTWDGPRLHSKGLSVDGRYPGDDGYPFRNSADFGPRVAGRFTLAAVGDLMLGRRVALRDAAMPADYVFARVAPELRADAAFANLEVALTDRGAPLHKDYTFRAPMAAAAGIRAAGIDLLSLANNHVLDFGPQGLTDTLGALDAAGIAHAGAGSDAAAAAAPAFLTLNGVRVALLSFVNVPNDSVTGFVTTRLAAGAGRPGVNWGTPEAVRQAVTTARARADVVIVSLHAGTEYAAEPNETQRALAHAAIDAGAALVVGAHPHVLQGIEYYREGVILYSLGNFVFDLDAADIRAYGLPAAETVVARVEFRSGRVSGLELRPAVIDSSEYRPVPARGSAARSVLDRVYRLTDELAAGAARGG